MDQKEVDVVHPKVLQGTFNPAEGLLVSMIPRVNLRG